MATKNDMTALENEYQAANTANQSFADYLQNEVDQMKAAQETEEQRKARVKQDKARAALTAVTEGIGNIYNLWNASANKGAVSVGGGASVTQLVDKQIMDDATARNANEEKFKAMQEKLNNVKAAAAKSNFENRLKMQDESRKQQAAEIAQQEEARRQEEHNYNKENNWGLNTGILQANKSKAEAEARSAKTQANNTQKIIDADLDYKSAQTESMRAGAEQKRMKAEHTRAVADKIRDNGATKVDPEKEMILEFDGVPYRGQVPNSAIDAIFNMPELADLKKEAIERRMVDKYGDNYQNSRDHKKTSSHFTLSVKERQEALRGALYDLMSSSWQQYPEIQARLTIYMKNNVTAAGETAGTVANAAQQTQTAAGKTAGTGANAAAGAVNGGKKKLFGKTLPQQ